MNARFPATNTHRSANGSHTSHAAAGLALATLLLARSTAFAHGVDLPVELPSNGEYLWLGVEHILSGFDHLLFLLGLIVAGGNLRSLLWTVSAFTLAHSITLAASVLGVVSVNGEWVEALIALSIAYVGVENLLRRTQNLNRAHLTFGFGLVHGLGFASALREIGVPADRAGGALVCFNLGVELGQLAVLSVVLPLLVRLRRSERVARLGMPALNAALVAAGVIWAVSRGLSAPSLAAARAPEQDAHPAAGVDDADLALDAPGRGAAKQDSRVPDEAPAHSVYPRELGPLQPSVQPLCAAFHTLPRAHAKRCGAPAGGFDFSGECTRMLNAAVASGAVRLPERDAAACLEAEQQRYARCDAAPASADQLTCSALWQGTLAQGARCRSSLECTAGLYCDGVSPVTVGTCSTPKPNGARCGVLVDPLASYVPHQPDQHPECVGTCQAGRCRQSAATTPKTQ